MTALELSKLIDKEIDLVDPRTGKAYFAVIADARVSWGKVQIRLKDSSLWFEPTTAELKGAA